MEYVEIKNLEKYHPGYTDRSLIWCKVYFNILNADPEFELMCEIDKWRFIAFIMLQLQIKKPVPLDKNYLLRKGFDLKKRPIQLTLLMLHKFINVRKQDENLASRRVEQSRVDKNRIEKSRIEDNDTITKECNKVKNVKNSIDDFPHLKDFSFKELWDSWIEVRKIKKVPNTDRALKIALGRLQAHPLKTAIQMLEKAVEGGWQGIY